MNIILFCNSNLALPSLHYLIQTSHLTGVVIPDIEHRTNQEVLHLTSQFHIPCLKVNKQDLIEKLPQWLRMQQADVCLVMTFPFKLPDVVLQTPQYGCFNFHFGLLPKYRGNDPIFWQLKNREAEGGVTIHQMTDEMDRGDIYTVWKMPVIPGENYGLHALRLSEQVVELLKDFISQLRTNQSVELIPQNEKEANWYGRPGSEDLCVDWELHTSEEIEALVNAANPVYEGASTYFQQSVWKILEVSPVTWDNPPVARAGTVVHCDAQIGMCVMCTDRKVLSLNVLYGDIGVISGKKLVSMGIRPGVQFYNNPTVLK